MILLTLSPTGAVTEASVFKSSGDSALDDAAVKAARATIYAPKVQHCAAVDGRYIFRADFNGANYVQPAPPTITVPPGWQAGQTPKGSQLHALSWSDTPQHRLIVSWHPDTRTIEQLRASEMSGTAGTHADEITNVALCNGTQTGIRFVHHKKDQQPEGVIEMIEANGMGYEAGYFGYDGAKPDASVMKALDSFCAPVVHIRP